MYLFSVVERERACCVCDKLVAAIAPSSAISFLTAHDDLKFMVVECKHIQRNELCLGVNESLCCVGPHVPLCALASHVMQRSKQHT